MMTVEQHTRAPIRRTGIVGVAAVPHAPQFLSLPDTEDHAQVERVRVAMGALGARLRALEPDCVIVLSNDHGDHFVTHAVAPFCVHGADRADGMHKHRGDWALDAPMAYPLVRAMGDEGFDLAFTLDAKIPTSFTIPYQFMGFDRDTPMTAIFVNAYVPPQPSPLRCHAFGQALARAVTGMGRRAVLIASGGMSHYPGTVHYPKPDIGTDRVLFEHMKAGNLAHLLAYDEDALDSTGNLELRMTLVAAGAIAANSGNGARKPFIAQLEPSWHHTYAVLGWDLSEPAERKPFIYPALPGARVALVRAVQTLRTDGAAARRFLEDPSAYCDGFTLAADERAALIASDFDALRDRFDVHALLTAGAIAQLRIQHGKDI
jgi:2,3-dihydroxyphenylpropionate 1,2-dioxygenase